MKLNGTWTALVTPFTDDLQVDWDGLKKNVEFQISEGISGVVPVGTTGESPTLSWEEHNGIVEKVASMSKGKCGVLAGTGSNSTAEAIESTKLAVEAGVDAVLLVDCYYNGPSSQELRDEYYGTIAEKFPNTTVVPYIIPGRSGTALSVEDLVVLSGKFKNINTVKEATGDLSRMAKTRKLADDDFSIMSGDDDLTYKMLTDPEIRANGVVSVMANVAPAAVAKMVNSVKSGDIKTAAKVHDALAPLLGMVTVKVDNPRTLPSGQTVLVNDRYRNPLAIKILMSGLGMPSGFCRKPLGKMTAAGVSVVRKIAQQVWQNNPEIFEPIARFYGVDIKARLANDSVWESLAL